MVHSPQASRRRSSFSAVAAGAMVFAGLTFAASPAQAADVYVTPGNLDLTQTRAAGHNNFVADGMHVYTDNNSSQAKAAGYFEVNKALASTGEPSMDVDPNDVTTTLLPGMQLATDFDNNGTFDGYLVGEPIYANGSPLYGDNWWLTGSAQQFVKDGAPSHGGGFGSDNNGTLAQWRVAFPNAKVLSFGWSLGSGVKADVTIHSMSLSGDTYKFAAGAPVTVDISAHGPLNKQVRIVTTAFDPEGGKLTYSVGKSTHGFAHIQPTGIINFNPYYGFVGTTSFTYSAKDTTGLTGTGTVTVTIDKAPSTLRVVKQYGPKGKVNVNVQITSAGQARGGTITIKEGGTTVATKVATGPSTVVQFAATAGSHTYDVTFGGSAQVLPSAATVTVPVS